MFKIKMIRTADGASMYMATMKPNTLHDANQIVQTLNRVNEEAAKLSGFAVRFVFRVVAK